MDAYVSKAGGGDGQLRCSDAQHRDNVEILMSWAQRSQADEKCAKIVCCSSTHLDACSILPAGVRDHGQVLAWAQGPGSQ